MPFLCDVTQSSQGPTPSGALPQPSSALAEGVLHFLGSLGQRSEAELYLRLFRSLSRGHFALLVPTRGVIEEHSGMVAEQLGFLRHLGLYPSLLLGAVDSVDQEHFDELERALGEVDLKPCFYDVGEGDKAELAREPSLAPDTIRVFRMSRPSDATLAQVTGEIAPRKVLFLRRAGGLGPHQGPRVELGPGHFLPAGGSGICVINLRNDATALLEQDFFGDQDRLWLARSEMVLEGSLGRDLRATVTVASPLSILRELFTVRGEGTLIKLGSAIQTVSGYEALARDRLETLLSDAFGRAVLPHFWSRAPLQVYLEADYRGVALLEPGRDAAFLSKFAVLPIAQGEGLGQDLWWALSKDYPAVYFRARVSNPINAWYRTVCDGMHRAGEWIVYWRGVKAERLPELIRDALSRPEDFEAHLAARL